MLSDEKFQKHIGPTWLTYYFGPEHKMEEKIILEENEYSEEDMSRKVGNVVSVYAPNSQQMKEMQSKIQDMVVNKRSSSLIRKGSSFTSDKSGGGGPYNPYVGSTT